jgi:hypothetical protein
VPFALESELDTLFQLPPAEMVAARNALVAQLKKAGQRDDAARIAALKRPAPAAWAINQVFFQERAVLERALAEVAQVRALQASDGVDRQQLAAAIAEQRRALQAIVDAALRHCAGAGLPAGAPQERRVFATVQSWLGGGGDEAPGRMTRELEPSGFEAQGQLGAPAPLPLPSAAPPRPVVKAQPTSAAKLAAPAEKPAPVVSLAKVARERAEQRVREHKQSVEWATERRAEQQKKHTVAEQAVERARHDVEDAERTLALRRAALAERETELTHKQSELEAAARARRDAEAQLAQARTELAKL